MRCTHCNAIIPEGWMRCPRCGKEVQIVPDYNPLDDVLTQEVKGSVEDVTRQLQTKDVRDFGRRQEKAFYRDRRWKRAKWRLWYGNRADRYGGSGQCIAWIAGDLLDFSRPAAFSFIYSGIFSSGSVGVSVDSDRCISGTFAFHFWSERVY